MKLALEEWGRHIRDDQQARLESATRHGCNAVDGTARQRVGTEGSQRLEQILREGYDVLLPMSGLDYGWHTGVLPAGSGGGSGDLAEILYKNHRCAQGHGDELPDGFELMPNRLPTSTVMIVHWNGRRSSDGRVRHQLQGLFVVGLGLALTGGSRWHSTPLPTHRARRGHGVGVGQADGDTAAFILFRRWVFSHRHTP